MLEGEAANIYLNSYINFSSMLFMIYPKKNNNNNNNNQVFVLKF